MKSSSRNHQMKYLLKVPNLTVIVKIHKIVKHFVLKTAVVDIGRFPKYLLREKKRNKYIATLN